MKRSKVLGELGGGAATMISTRKSFGISTQYFMARLLTAVESKPAWLGHRPPPLLCVWARSHFLSLN